MKIWSGFDLLQPASQPAIAKHLNTFKVAFTVISDYLLFYLRNSIKKIFLQVILRKPDIF